MNEQLIAEIYKAFPVEPIPDTKILKCECYFDSECEEYFKGSKWIDHSARLLRRHEVCLGFMTRSAFTYYLPAYLMAELKEPEEADIIADNLSYTFKNIKSCSEKMSYLNSKQIETIIKFFDFCSEEYDDEELELTCFQDAANQIRSQNG